MRPNHHLAGLLAAVLLAVPVPSLAQTNAEAQAEITVLWHHVAALLRQIADLQAAKTAVPTSPSCTALAGAFAEGSVTDACLVNPHLSCSESSLRTQVECRAGQWRSTQTPPAAPPDVSTVGCIPLVDAQTTSGHNFCGDLYCPHNAPTQRYWCRAGKSPAAWYSSALACTGLSCLI